MDSNFGLKGDEFMIKGDKTLKGMKQSWLFIGSMGNKTDRAEKAMNIYKQAATQYKLAKRCNNSFIYKIGEDAATAYKRCVTCDKSLKSGESADFLVEAANAIKKVNTAGNLFDLFQIEAIEYMDQAIEVYCADNRID